MINDSIPREGAAEGARVMELLSMSMWDWDESVSRTAADFSASTLTVAVTASSAMAIGRSIGAGLRTSIAMCCV